MNVPTWMIDYLREKVPQDATGYVRMNLNEGGITDIEYFDKRDAKKCRRQVSLLDNRQNSY